VEFIQFIFLRFIVMLYNNHYCVSHICSLHDVIAFTVKILQPLWPSWKKINLTGRVSHCLGKSYTVVVCTHIIVLWFRVVKNWYGLKSTIYILSNCPNKSHNLPILLFTSKILPDTIIFGKGWELHPFFGARMTSTRFNCK